MLVTKKIGGGGGGGDLAIIMRGIWLSRGSRSGSSPGLSWNLLLLRSSSGLIASGGNGGGRLRRRNQSSSAQNCMAINTRHFSTKGEDRLEFRGKYVKNLLPHLSTLKKKSFLTKFAVACLGGICLEMYVLRERLQEGPFAKVFDKMSFYWNIKVIPWLSSCLESEHTNLSRYIEQTKMASENIRLVAIKKLSEFKYLSDAECSFIASTIDFKTAISLAHNGADPRMCSMNYGKPVDRLEKLPRRFRALFRILPPENIHPNVWTECKQALRMFDPTDEEKEEKKYDDVSGFVSEPHPVESSRLMSEDTVLHSCLNTLRSHARIQEQVPLITQNGGLELVMDVAEKYVNDPQMLMLVSKILCFLTSHEPSLPDFRINGMLRLLAELARDENIRISLPAKTALHNLDRRYNSPLLQPGVYQLFPDYLFDESRLDFDVIFVHGVLGGAFRTWRRQDLDALYKIDWAGVRSLKEACDRKIALWQEKVKFLRGHSPFSIRGDPSNETSDSGGRSVWYDKIKSLRERIPTIKYPELLADPEQDITPKNRELREGKMYVFDESESIPLESSFVTSSDTKCWPHSWLPGDVQAARILALDYDTFATHWSPVLPIECLSATIEERSGEMIKKLVGAGIGKRPILWVTHSAGGILMKYIIARASESLDPNFQNVAKSTRGVIFCSTPHFGSPVTFEKSKQLFLRPTQEILELHSGAEHLRILNGKFQEVAEKFGYHVVSLGELAATYDVLGVSGRFVSLKSSDPGFGEYYALDIDHLNICKPLSRGSFIYLKVVDMINSLRNRTYGQGEGFVKKINRSFISESEFSGREEVLAESPT